MRRASVVAAAAAAAMALAGCSASVSVGGDRTISADEIEQNVREQYDERTGSGITLTELKCDESTAEVGAELSCTGRNSRDIDLEIAGEVTAVDGGTASYTWRIVRAHAPGAFYERGARRVLEEQAGLQVREIRCPVRIELRVGSRVECTVTPIDGEPVPAVLELTDMDGGFNISRGTARVPSTTAP